MPDDKNKNEYGIVPNDVSFDQAVHDLLRGVSAENGGYPPPGDEKKEKQVGNQVYLAVGIRAHDYLKENGTSIITYNFEDGLYQESCPLDPEERIAVRKVMDQFEKVANVRFVEGRRRFEEVDEDLSDVCITTIEDYSEEYAGSAAGNLITLDKQYATDVRVIAHEICHTMGISHPGEDPRDFDNTGNNPLYNEDATVMSYNAGDSRVEGLGAFDVAALQAMFGKPKPRPDDPDVLSAEDLKGTKYLFKQKPFTLDLSDRPRRGDLNIDMEKGIEGYLMDDKFNPEGRVNLLYTPDTELKDIVPGDLIRLTISGNEKPNHLRGGAMNDTLTPRGGEDVLTGGGGGDTFVLDEKSGLSNVITDFSATGLDSIALKEAIAKAELRYGNLPSADGKSEKGTELLAKNEAGDVVASFLIPGATPEQVSRNIKADHATVEIVTAPVTPVALSQSKTPGK